MAGDGTAYTAYTLILPDAVTVKITIPVTKLAINDNARVLAVGHIYDPLRKKRNNTVQFYHALTNALSAHMIQINLNMTLYTHVQQSYQNNLHKALFCNNLALYGEKETPPPQKKKKGGGGG